MRQYGLIGFPLSHSFSKKYFAEKFKTENITDAHYDVYPISRTCKTCWMHTPTFAG
jgi:shikimate dehydrogenase